jgi:hypothetical protein
MANPGIEKKLRNYQLQVMRTDQEQEKKQRKMAVSLREGMLMKEILGPPRALKPYRFSLFR